MYRVQNIYTFFGEGQKGGAKASAWPYNLSDLLDVIREMGMPQTNQKRVKLPQTIMAQIDKSGDFDTLIESIGKWLEDKKAAQAKEAGTRESRCRGSRRGGAKESPLGSPR